MVGDRWAGVDTAEHYLCHKSSRESARRSGKRLRKVILKRNGVCLSFSFSFSYSFVCFYLSGVV